MPRSLNVATSDSNARRNVCPVGGNDGSEGGTELLPFALTAFQGTTSARVGFGAGGGHGAGGVEEVAKGKETLGGGARAVQLDLESDAPLERFCIGRVHEFIIPMVVG